MCVPYFPQHARHVLAQQRFATIEVDAFQSSEIQIQFYRATMYGAKISAAGRQPMFAILCGPGTGKVTVAHDTLGIADGFYIVVYAQKFYSVRIRALDVLIAHAPEAVCALAFLAPAVITAGYGFTGLYSAPLIGKIWICLEVYVILGGITGVHTAGADLGLIAWELFYVDVLEDVRTIDWIVIHAWDL